jgi:hypothetical protein
MYGRPFRDVVKRGTNKLQLCLFLNDLGRLDEGPCRFVFLNLSLEFVGPLPKSPQSKEYLLTIPDMFTRYVVRDVRQRRQDSHGGNLYPALGSVS